MGRHLKTRCLSIAGSGKNYSGKPGHTVLELPITRRRLVPYYVAAHLVIGEDSFVNATLYNEFESRLERLKPRLRARRSLSRMLTGLREFIKRYLLLAARH